MLGGMTTLRRLATPLRLARARLARRLERVALVALGIAAGAAMLSAVLGGSLLARDQSLERATTRIAPQDRAVRALWFGIPAQDASRTQLDAWATDALRGFGDVTPRSSTARHPWTASSSTSRRWTERGGSCG